MSKIHRISEWRRVFVDTSFIIDSVRDLAMLSDSDPKFQSVRKSHELLAHFQKSADLKGQSIRWVTSSIVLSELLKFENKDAVNELQKTFKTPEVEIINFTEREASFILNDMADFIEQKHIGQYIKELQKALAEKHVFNPKNYIAKDALIIACAKSKPCDVVLTYDRNSFMPIAKQVKLPILLSEDIPMDMYNSIDYQNPITTDY